MRTQEPWLPYDPTWLVELAKIHEPHKDWLQNALRGCTLAQRKTCCAPKICGFRFVEQSETQEQGWKPIFSTVFIGYPHERDVFVQFGKNRRIVSVEVSPPFTLA